MKTMRPWIMTLALVLGAMNQLHAAESRIPIYQATTITQPGHCMVTRDIALSSGIAIDIQADGVTVDLNGHTLSNTASFNLIEIKSTAGTASGVTIRNGRITGGLRAIWASATGDSTRRRIVLENLEISGTSWVGVELQSVDHVDVTRCRVLGTAHAAIAADGSGSAFSGTFTDNVIESPGDEGLRLTGMRGGILRGNMITGAGFADPNHPGISLVGNVGFDSGGILIVDNTIRGTAGANHGLRVASYVNSNLILRNVLTNNGGDGIRIDADSAGHRVAHNTSNDNTGAGLYVAGDYALIEDNTLVGNDNAGIYCDASSGSAWRNNMLRGNTPNSITAVSCTSTDEGGNIP